MKSNLLCRDSARDDPSGIRFQHRWSLEESDWLLLTNNMVTIERSALWRRRVRARAARVIIVAVCYLRRSTSNHNISSTLLLNQIVAVLTSET